MKKIFFAIALLTTACSYSVNNFVIQGHGWKSGILSQRLAQSFGIFNTLNKYGQLDPNNTSATFTVTLSNKKMTKCSFDLLKKVIQELGFGLKKCDLQTIKSKQLVENLNLNNIYIDKILGAIELGEFLQVPKSVIAILTFNIKSNWGYPSLSDKEKNNLDSLYKKAAKDIPLRYNY